MMHNKTKHDRSQHLSEATFQCCIEAVVACLIMHSVKFSPFQMLEEHYLFNVLVNQHFLCRLTNDPSKTFYLPEIKVPDNFSDELIIYDPRNYGHVQALITEKLVL